MPKKLTYQELLKIAPKDKPFWIKVESRPNGTCEPKVLKAGILDTEDGLILNTLFYGNEIDYKYIDLWCTDYEGEFEYLGDGKRPMKEKDIAMQSQEAKPKVKKYKEYLIVVKESLDDLQRIMNDLARNEGYILDKPIEYTELKSERHGWKHTFIATLVREVEEEIK